LLPSMQRRNRDRAVCRTRPYFLRHLHLNIRHFKSLKGRSPKSDKVLSMRIRALRSLPTMKYLYCAHAQGFYFLRRGGQYLHGLCPMRSCPGTLSCVRTASAVEAGCVPGVPRNHRAAALVRLTFSQEE
jgi:hypothetical protein